MSAFMNLKNTDIQNQVIQTVKKLRIEQGISQSSLSNILGVSDGQIGNIESPKYQHKYTLKQLYDFCSFIKYPFENLFLSDNELKSKDAIKILIKKLIEYDK
jgi:putative transcriptional regulator